MMGKVRGVFIFLAIAVLAAVLSACGNGGDEDASTAAQSSAPAAKIGGVQSGLIDLTVVIEATGGEGGDLDFHAVGPFSTRDGKAVFDVAVEAFGKSESQDIHFEGDMIWLADRAYVATEGEVYKMDAGSVSAVPPDPDKGGISSCREGAANLGLEVTDFIDDLQEEGKAEVAEANTTKYSGAFDTEGVDLLVEAFESPGCKDQLESSEVFSTIERLRTVPEIAKALETSLGTTQVDAYVDANDFLRRISAKGTITQEDPEAYGPTSAKFSFDLILSEINEKQTIAEPQPTEPLNEFPVDAQSLPLSVVLAIGGLRETLLR